MAPAAPGSMAEMYTAHRSPNWLSTAAGPAAAPSCPARPPPRTPSRARSSHLEHHPEPDREVGVDVAVHEPHSYTYKKKPQSFVACQQHVCMCVSRPSIVQRL
jgi:hypothetical protein